MGANAEDSSEKRPPPLVERIMEEFEELADTVRIISRISGMGEVARRYAVTNSFDSLLTMLGVLMGSFISGLKEPSVIINTVLGGAVAILISGTMGTYLTERAERASRIKELEVAVLMDLDETLVGKAESISAVMVAVASGLAPFLVMMSLTVPFYLSTGGMLSVMEAYVISFMEVLSILFTLGVFLGSLSGENRLVYGAMLVGMGLLIVMVMLWLGISG